jgi:predicted nucleic acid-binding protein
MDSSALAKRVVNEPESPRLLTVLRGMVANGDQLVTSELTVIEVSRTLRRRLDAESPRHVVEAIDVALAGLKTMPISGQVTDVARRLGPSSLRSLDAIHLATATLIGADIVLAYDDRLLRSAEEVGFATLTP